MTPFVPVRWLIDTPGSSDPDFFPLLVGQYFLEEKTPIWSTKIQTAKSGRELRAAAWSTPRWRFKVGYEFLRDRPPTQNELNQLYAFFNKRQGRFGTFLYQDPSEAPVVDQFLGYGDGLNTVFQLTRTLDDWTEPVYKVVGDPSFKVNGVNEPAFTVSEYGVVTFTTPPPDAQPVSWSGLVAYWCRFDQDEINPSQMVKDIWSLDGISFISIKP